MPADKTTNYYKMNATSYEKLLNKNVQKDYKKAPTNAQQSINVEAKNIAHKLGISNRVDILACKESFITLKDHKDNFPNNPSCRLINPTKSELGRVSKHILDRINKEIIASTAVLQWKNTEQALSWFEKIPNKGQHSFISFDIANFYPSISLELK